MNSSINALKFSPASATAKAAYPAHAGRLARFGAAVWRTLEEIGQARARHELLALADRWDVGQPELAAQLRATSRSLEQPAAANRG